MKNKINLKSILMTVVGTAMAGFAIGVFFAPNRIVGGGVSGIATLLYHSFSAPTGLTYFLINLLFLLASVWVLGRSFVLNTLAGVSLLSVFTQIFSYIPYYTDNLIIPTIFGGALYGIGIGISFAAGASTGGTDIIGRLVQHKFNTVPIGKLLLVIDGIIIIISLAVFKELELTLFGIITLFISSYSVDFVINTLNVSKIAFVITTRGEDIAELLVGTSQRGVTLINAVGAYTNTKKKMLFCALKESETAVFQQKILDIDPEAFIVFSVSEKIKGKGFYLYK